MIGTNVISHQSSFKDVGLRTCSARSADVTDNQIVVSGHKRGSNATFLYPSSPPDIAYDSKISVNTIAK